MQSRLIRQREFAHDLPVIGKVKTGEKVDGIPKSLDYFRATGLYDVRFREIFGEKPRYITITFHTDDVGKVVREYMELRDNQGKRVAYGDGAEFKVYDEKRDDYLLFRFEEHPDIVDRLEKKYQKAFYVVMDLYFIIPELKGVLGLWHYQTKGDRSSIPGIMATIDTLHGAGKIAWIPYELQVEMVKSQKPGSKARFPVVRLVPTISQESVGKLKLLQEGVQELLTEDRIKSLTE